jgi:hypothetical protein
MLDARVYIRVARSGVVVGCLFVRTKNEETKRRRGDQKDGCGTV